MSGSWKAAETQPLCRIWLQGRGGQTEFFMSWQIWKMKQKNYKIQHIHLRLETEGNKISLLPTTFSASLRNTGICLLWILWWYTMSTEISEFWPSTQNKRKANWKLAPLSLYVRLVFCLGFCCCHCCSQAQIQDRCKTISTLCQEGLLATTT